MPDYSTLPAYFRDLARDPSTPWPDAVFLERTLAQQPLFVPGAGWSYSNIGYLIVRRIIERVTGQPLRDILTERIVRPLGLRQTTVARTLADSTDLTPGWGRELNTDDRLEDISSRYHPGWVSHGVVVSTACETALMLDAILTRQLLSPEARRQMLRGSDVPGSHPPFHRAAYGLGVMLDLAAPAGLIAGHGGGGPGYSTAAFAFEHPDGQRVTCVALVNGSNAPAQAIVFATVAAFRGQPGPGQS